MLGFFRRIAVKDRDLDQVQTNVGALLNKLLKIAFLDGTTIEVDLAAGENILNHKLLRKPLGWYVVDQDAAVTVYRVAWDSATITLNSSGAAAVKIWVF